MTTADTGADDPLAALIRFYVSPQHRDDPAGGCAFASLATDAARSSGPAFRALIGDLVVRYVDLLTDLSSGDDVRRTAIATVAQIVGAIVLSRAIPDRSQSDEVLEVVRPRNAPPKR